MSRPKDPRPVVSRAPVARPPVALRGEPIRVPPVVSPSMTPAEREQAEAYASDRPLHRPGRTLSAEPPIRDPARLAEVRAQLLGGDVPSAVTPVLAEFGRALRAERERQGLSLSEVSERCGVEKAALSRLENGLNPNPTLDTLRRCARALGKAVALGLADREEVPAASAPAESARSRIDSPDRKARLGV